MIEEFTGGHFTESWAKGIEFTCVSGMCDVSQIDTDVDRIANAIYANTAAIYTLNQSVRFSCLLVMVGLAGIALALRR